MNEFTKEELEIIAECVDADFYHTNWSKSMYEPLITKIQSMIDNYCEHETDQGGCGGDMLYTCKKCGNKYRYIPK